jgi:CBS domain-containing protein
VKVREIMTTSVKTIPSGATLAEAGRTMAAAACGFLPVVDGNDKVVGVITDRNICIAVTEADRRASEMSVRDWMSARVHACGPEDDLGRALSTMQFRLVRRLPVIDDRGQLVGVVSIDDVVANAAPASASAAVAVTYGEAFTALRIVSAVRPRPRYRVADAPLSAVR